MTHTLESGLKVRVELWSIPTKEGSDTFGWVPSLLSKDISYEAAQLEQFAYKNESLRAGGEIFKEYRIIIRRN